MLCSDNEDLQIADSSCPHAPEVLGKDSKENERCGFVPASAGFLGRRKIKAELEPLEALSSQAADEA